MGEVFGSVEEECTTISVSLCVFWHGGVSIEVSKVSSLLQLCHISSFVKLINT